MMDRPGQKWTDEQRRMLIECMFHMTEITRHGLNDCTNEMRRLVREYRDRQARRNQSEE